MSCFHSVCRFFFSIVTVAAFCASVPAYSQSAAVARVIIVLNSQPQAAISSDARSRYGEALSDDQEMTIRRVVASETASAIQPSQDAVAGWLRMAGATGIQRYRAINAMSADVPTSALEDLRKLPGVRSVFPAQNLRGQLDVSGQVIGAPAFWDAGLTGAGQSIVMIDSGVDVRNPAFAGANIITGPILTTQPNFYGACPDTLPGDDCTPMGHGTAVAGVLVSQGAPGFSRHLGIARRATLYNIPATFLSEEGNYYLSTTDILAAIDWTLANTPASIVNLSYADHTYFPEFIETLDQIMADHNLMIVSPVSPDINLCNTLWPMPAMSYNGIGVAAFDDRNTVPRTDDVLSPHNPTGPAPNGPRKPDLIAPGVNIQAPLNYSEVGGPVFGYARACHASLAVPHVSGALALLRQYGITDTLMAKAVLINSADGETWSPTRGWGAIDLVKAKVRGSRLTGRAGDHQPAFFIGPVDSGPMKVTVVTKTRPGSGGTRVFLSVFRRSDHAGVLFAGLPANNVAQGRVPGGNYVIKVDSDAGIGDPANFALALSREGFRSATAPRVTIKCSAPAQVVLGGAVTVTCTASNSGDIEAHEVKALPGGPAFTECTIDFGVVNGHGTRTQQCTARAARTGVEPVGVFLPEYFAYQAWDERDPPEGTSTAPVRVLGTSGAILGRVLGADGKALKGVNVRLTGASTASVLTDAKGEFAFTNLTVGSGPTTVTATAAGVVFQPASTVVPTISGSFAEIVEFRAGGPI